MIVCRFSRGDDVVRVGLVESRGAELVDLTPAGVGTLEFLLEDDDPVALVTRARAQASDPVPLTAVRLHAPVDRQEIWAAGVTYLRSKAARMEESDFSASAYDRVYEAERPEIFFKSLPEKVVRPGDLVGIRRDSKWNVPEPELALVLNSRGRLVGYTIGNDMSSRDIEGANLLYLPQAKMYDRSCALGPWIRLGVSEAEAREWTIRITIHRDGQPVFAGETSVGKIVRRFDDLIECLFRSQVFGHGAVLLTGTGIVPDDTFTLQERDAIEIEITGIGVLRNSVVIV
jgi:2-dehydro-3-deoxy-D-arabinonate dehydratase